MPFFHIGSENIWISPRNKEVHRSLWLSVQTGLPISSSFMGRTSVGQVINQLELIAEPYRNPQLLEDLPSDKDFLVFLHKKAYEMKGKPRAHFTRGLPLIHEDKEVAVYRLSIAELKKRVVEKEKDSRNKYEAARLFEFSNVESADSIQDIIYLNFDDLKSSKVYQGSGAFEAAGFPGQLIFDGHIPFQQTKKAISFRSGALCKGI